MIETVKRNLLQIQEDVAPYKPNIIAVTKYFDENAIVDAYNAGLRNFAESRVIEAIEKIERHPLEIRKNSTFHFIGHLQTNKVKKVIKYFDYIHSVDSLKLAENISEEAQKVGKVQKILLQINNANEEQKFGLSKEEVFEIFPWVQSLPSVQLGMLFEEISQIKSQLEEKFNCKLKEISMGMSQDYKVAVRHGATMVRIGRKLFK